MSSAKRGWASRACSAWSLTAPRSHRNGRARSAPAVRFTGVLVGRGCRCSPTRLGRLVMVWIVVGAFLHRLHAALATFHGAGTCRRSAAFNFRRCSPDRRAQLRQRPDGGLIAPADAQVPASVSNTCAPRRHRSANNVGASSRVFAASASCFRQQHRVRDHHHRRHRRVLAHRGGLRARRLDGRHGHGAGGRANCVAISTASGLQLVARRSAGASSSCSAEVRPARCRLRRVTALLFGAIASLFIPWACPP